MQQPADIPPSPNDPGLAPPEALALVYEELRALARRRMAAENIGHTMQATALVHEAYLRLAGPLRFANQSHFFHAAAEAMRRILIDHARGKKRIKRGGPTARRMPLSVLDLAACPEPAEIMAFDDAISRLEKESPTAGAVVRLRFYAGLNIDEVATSLGLSPRTVDREWTYARAWLFRALEAEAS